MNEKLYRIKPITFAPHAGYVFGDTADKLVADTPYGVLTVFRDATGWDDGSPSAWFFQDVNGDVLFKHYDTVDDAVAAAVRWYELRATECMDAVTDG